MSVTFALFQLVKGNCKSYLRSEDLQQVTLAYGYYVRPHAFDEAVWSTAGQCELSVRPRDTTSCTESGIRTRTTDLQLGESTLKPTVPTGPTNDFISSPVGSLCHTRGVVRRPSSVVCRMSCVVCVHHNYQK